MILIGKEQQECLHFGMKTKKAWTSMKNQFISQSRDSVRLFNLKNDLHHHLPQNSTQSAHLIRRFILLLFKLTISSVQQFASRLFNSLK